MIHKFFLFIFTIISISIFAQNKYPQHYFRSPIDFQIQIAGNFGELRSNHFHTGLDILTEGVQGKKVYSIADGYVSRINVSGGGYGNALYITHPNGYVSVYGHLKSFRKDIAAYLDSIRHEKHVFSINLYPLPHQFPVKKGDFIALSGNSGRSSGPHIHFEIRERDSEEPVNPFLFGIKIKDDVAPRIFSITQYNFNDTIDWDNFTKKTYSYKYISGKTIKINGNTGFGIELQDYTTGRHNRNGIYQLTMKIDDTVYFDVKFDKLSFYTNRYINSYIDYGSYLYNKKRITKCFVEPNNKWENYLVKKNRGIYKVIDDSIHRVKIIAKDFYGNKKTIRFNIIRDTTKVYAKPFKNKYFVQKLYCKKENFYNSPNLKINFHRNSLLYDLNFIHFTTKAKFKAYSSVHHIHKERTPLFNKISIAIKTDSLPKNLQSKVLIAKINNQGKLSSAGGEYIDGYVIGKINSFGNYVLTVDTIKPRIVPLSLAKTNVIYKSMLRFKIYDNLSGIKSFNGFIDNKWVLFTYDTKYHLIQCNLKIEKIKKGKHELVLKVEDKYGNIETFTSNFTYK
ncbi:MAG: M23 family metallopeptidase [Bacteroidales bacterium]|nr:M23 family metallopeptidase [Bacteroidales bacterium]